MKKLVFLISLILMQQIQAAECATKAEKLALKNAIGKTTLDSEGESEWEVFSVKLPLGSALDKDSLVKLIPYVYVEKVHQSEMQIGKNAISFFDQEIDNLNDYSSEYSEDYDYKRDLENYKTTKQTFIELFGDKVYFLEVIDGHEDAGVFEKVIFGIKPDGCIIGISAAEFWT